MSTWVISTADSTHSRGLTAGRGHRDAAVLRSSAKSPPVEKGGKIKAYICVKETECYNIDLF